MKAIRRLLILSTALSASVAFSSASATGSFSFRLDRVDDQRVAFVSSSAAWTAVSYSCDGCSFFLSRAGVHGLTSLPSSKDPAGLVIQLTGGRKTLHFACHAHACELRFTTNSRPEETRKLTMGQVLDIPVTATLQGDVTE